MYNMENTQENSIFIRIWFKNGGKTSFKSFSKEKHKSKEYLINKMKKRLLDKTYLGKYSTAIFYDNNTNTELKRFVNGLENNESKKTVKNPIIFVRIWFLDGGKTSFPNFEQNNHYGIDWNVQLMEKEILSKYYGKYSSAIFYDNKTKKEICKWVYSEKITN